MYTGTRLTTAIHRLAFVAVNIRNLPLTLSAHKKNELNLWACLSLNVDHVQFEFRQVLDHNSLL